MKEVKRHTGNEQIFLEKLDLGSLKSVRAFARKFTEEYRQLHVLVNNAGMYLSFSEGRSFITRFKNVETRREGAWSINFISQRSIYHNLSNLSRRNGIWNLRHISLRIDLKIWCSIWPTKEIIYLIRINFRANSRRDTKMCESLCDNYAQLGGARK